MGYSNKFFHPRDSASGSESTEENVEIGALEALEAYSAEHPETIEELKNWHWKKFESFYIAFMKRKAIEDANQTKNAMISGLWSNPNYDDDKNTRKDALLNIEKMYNDAVIFIYSGRNREEEEEAKMLEDPFFTAIKMSEGIDQSDAPNP